MSAPRSTRPAATGRPLKSPLAVHSDHATVMGFDGPDRRTAAAVSDRTRRSARTSARPSTWTSTWTNG